MLTTRLAGRLIAVAGLAAGAVGFAGAGGGPEGICSALKLEHASGSPIHVGPMAGRPVIGDMNGDNRPDIVVACGTCCGSPSSPQSGHVVVLLNEGNGAFTRAPGGRVIVGPSVRKIALADVNNDGATDVLAAEHDTYDVTVLVNDGSGTLKPGGSFPAAGGVRPHTHEIASADMNGDGNADVLTTNANDNTISVLLGDGKGSFAAAPGSPFAAGRHPYDALAIADVNGDGRLDVVVPLLAAGKIGVMIGDGRGGLTEGFKQVVAERPGYVAVADVNGDGRADIVGTHDDVGLVDVLLGDGKGSFAAAPGSPMKLDTPVWGVAVADMNRDGKADFVLGGANGREIVVAMGGGGAKVARQDAHRADEQPNYVAVADLDGDKRLDVVTGNYGSGSVSVLLAR